MRQRTIRLQIKAPAENSVTTVGRHPRTSRRALSRIVSMGTYRLATGGPRACVVTFVPQPEKQLRPTYAIGCSGKASEFVRVPNTLEHLSLDWRTVPIAVNSENNVGAERRQARILCQIASQ
jgi:hypothetical protein